MGNNGNGPDEVVAGATPEALAAAQSHIAELTSQLGARDARIGELQAALASHSEATTQRDVEIISLRADVANAMAVQAQLDATTQSLTASLGSAITKYREMLVIANPLIPPEMFSGDNIADIDASIERAKGLVIRVRASLEEQARNTAIPAGSPERSSPDLSSLSPREKIQYAIRKESK